MRIRPKNEPLIFSLAYLVCFSFILLLTYYWENYISQDQAMYLYAGKLILQGQIPFVDFFDINPPLIMYLNAAVVYIANSLQVNEIQLYKVFVTFLYFSFIYISLKVLRKNFGLTRIGYFAALFILTLMLIPSLYLGFWGQRDELFGFALIPYLFIKVARLMSKDPKSQAFSLNNLDVIWAGLWFAIFICFKPHFFVIFVIAEIYFWYMHRDPRALATTESGLTLITVVIYLLLISRLPSVAISNFLQNAQDVLKYYSSFDRYVLNALPPASLLCLPSFLSLLYIYLNKKKVDPYIIPFCLSVPIWLGVVFWQGRLFQYHFSGVFILGVFLSIIICLKRYSGHLPRALRFIPAFFVLFFSLFCGIQYYNKQVSFFNYNRVLQAEIAKYTKYNDYALTLASIPRLSYPVYNNLGLKNASRYLFAYPINFYGSLRFDSKSGLLDIPLDASAAEKEKKYFDDLKADISTYAPKVIYFDRSELYTQNFPPGFPLKKYLEMNGVISFIEPFYNKVSNGTFDIYVRKE